MSTQASLWLKRVAAASLAAALVLPLAPTPAVAEPGAVTDLPVLSRETPAGGGTVASVDGPAPTSKTIDGHIDDWTGEPTRYGGTAVYSAGELVYQDHLFDALGPDDGRDADRLATTDPIEQAAPETYRIDALAQADAPGEFGAPTPEQFSWDDTYGDAVDHQDAADIEELRLALDGDRLDVLLRTTTMRTPSDTALLLLADTQRVRTFMTCLSTAGFARPSRTSRCSLRTAPCGSPIWRPETSPIWVARPQPQTRAAGRTPSKLPCRPRPSRIRTEL